MRRDARGFTLLEVMVSLALLGIFVLIILQGIGQAVMLKADEAQIITATQLAQAKMVELEIQLNEDGFSDFEQEECGEFRDEFGRYTEGFDDFQWCYNVKKVELSIPQEMLSALAGDAAGDAASGGGQDFVQGEGGGTTDLLSSLGIDMETVTEQLSEGIRMLEVTVKWGKGDDAQDVTLSTHLVRMSEVEGLPQ